MTSALPLGTALRRLVLTVLISAVGGGAAALLHIPAGWLAGGALAVALAALSGVKVHMPDRLRDLVFVLTGLSMGAAVSRDSLALMIQWPVTLAALVVELVLIITLTGYLLRRIFGLDRGTAYLSSFPGHLSFVMSIAAAGLGDTRQIVIIQVTRILVLTICVPIGALLLPVGHYSAASGSAEPMSLVTLILVAIACGIVGYHLRPSQDAGGIRPRCHGDIDRRQVRGMVRRAASAVLSRDGVRPCGCPDRLALRGHHPR